MPERLDRVQLDLGRREPFVMGRADREALLERLDLMPGTSRIGKAIHDVGASRPAPLKEHDRLALYGALEAWAQQAAKGRWPPLPRRIEELRFLLARDVAG